MERKEAIEVIKKNWPDSSFTMLREALETLIPELAESEDERLKKEIMDFVVGNTICKDGRRETYLAWLEKQGKNKDFPPVTDRETLDEYAYQVAYDLSNDWLKDTPTWDDVKIAVKLGAKWFEKQGKQNPNCIQITITQNIIDYINQNKAKFELDIPKLGDIWNIKEIHTYPGNPIVELENGEGAWLNLPLHVVFDNLMTI